MRVQCSTCLELLTPGDDLTCTPCGHVFHLHCVVQWFENKKNCPQCRHAANERTLRKIYLAETDGEQVSVDDLQNQLESAQFQLRCVRAEQQKILDKSQLLDSQNRQLKEELKTSETGRRKAKELVEGYKTQVKFLNEERERNESYRLEADRCKKQLDQYKAIQLVLAGSEGEVNRMLHERGAFDGKSRDLAVLIVEMKKKVVDLKRERSLYEQRAQDSGRQCEELRRQLKNAQQELQECRQAKAALERDHVATLAENKKLLAREREWSASRERLASSSGSTGEPGSPLARRWSEDDSPGSVCPPPPGSPPPGPPLVAVPFKSCAIVLGEKRKPLAERNCDDGGKRLRLGGNLYENFKKVEQQDEKRYDGLGGRSKNDEFPRPLPLAARPFAKLALQKKRPATTNSHLTQARISQAQTIDKYFGNFDTP